MPSPAPVRGTRVGAWFSPLQFQTPRQLDHITENCVSFYVYTRLQMKEFAFMCTYKVHRHQVWRGFRCWEGGLEVRRGRSYVLLQAVFVVAQPASIAHMSICTYSRIHKHLTHYFTNFCGLPESHRGGRLNLSKKKQTAFKKGKRKGRDAGLCFWKISQTA